LHSNEVLATLISKWIPIASCEAYIQILSCSHNKVHIVTLYLSLPEALPSLKRTSTKIFCPHLNVMSLNIHPLPLSHTIFHASKDIMM
jgi:hypothetical protein